MNKLFKNNILITILASSYIFTSFGISNEIDQTNENKLIKLAKNLDQNLNKINRCFANNDPKDPNYCGDYPRRLNVVDSVDSVTGVRKQYLLSKNTINNKDHYTAKMNIILQHKEIQEIN